MQKKINEDFIDSYCEKFASKVTNSFFTGDKITISGKEILKVTPSKQTNYFVVKLLFRYWQGETRKLESPFFNYEQEEVREALVEFMNVLSQHIDVHKNGFQMLLNHAVKDTLYLAASPQAYVEIDLDDRGIDKIDEGVVEETLKYLKTYKREIGNFLSDMQGLNIDDVIDELPEEFEQFDSSRGLQKEVELLSEIHPIKADQVLIEELPDDFEDDDTFDNDEKIAQLEAAEKKKEEGEIPEEVEIPEGMKWHDETIKDFGEGMDMQPMDEPSPKEKLPEVESIKEGNQEMEPEPEKIDEEKESLGQKVEEESRVFDKGETKEESEGDLENIKEENKEEGEHVEEVKTINDQFEAPEKTVVEHHEEAKASSMMELISVNHQFMFVKDLFKDDQVSFQNALYELEEFDSFDDAVEFLVQGYAKEFSWDMQSIEVKELLKVLFRKFRN